MILLDLDWHRIDGLMGSIYLNLFELKATELLATYHGHSKQEQVLQMIVAFNDVISENTMIKKHNINWTRNRVFENHKDVKWFQNGMACG